VDAVVVVGELGGTKAAHPPTKRRMAAVLADDLIVESLSIVEYR
jgi:hypothetical protein